MALKTTKQAEAKQDTFLFITLECETNTKGFSSLQVLKNVFRGDKDMTQQLGALAAPPEDLELIPSTYMAAHNCL